MDEVQPAMNKSDFTNTPLKTNVYVLKTFKTCILIVKSLLLILIWCILLITSKSSVFSKANLPDRQIIDSINIISININSINMPKYIQTPRTADESKDLAAVESKVSNLAETIAPDKATAKAEATIKTEASTTEESTAAESASVYKEIEIEGKSPVQTSMAAEENTAVGENKAVEPLEATSDGNPIGLDDLEEINYEEALLNLGYLNESTYDHAYNVYIAVLLFQANHNLVVDGIWGDSSMQALIKHMKTNMFMYRDKVANPASEGRWIAINLTKRLLTLYEGTGVISKYPIAVGNPPTLTPEGKFSIVNKLVNPYWGGAGYAAPVEGGSPYNPLGYRWLGISIGDGYSYGIHGTNSPYSIGTNASLGCIRMPNFCVEQLFELVEIYTPVWIGFDETLASWGIEQIEY